MVIQSAREYLEGRVNEKALQAATLFIDEYTNGYGKYDRKVLETIEMVLKTYGIPLDATYTGKAFMGMSDYLKAVKGRNVLFIHTGGTPLFFNALGKISRSR